MKSPVLTTVGAPCEWPSLLLFTCAPKADALEQEERGAAVHVRSIVYFQSCETQDYVRDDRENTMVIGRSKSGQIARAATNLGISVAGLVIIRFIVQGLPMFQDMGWIAKDKLTVVAAAVIVVDAMLLSVLIGFAIQLRAYLLARFAEIPGLGTMAVSLVLLICAAIAYTDFKPLTRAWPSIKQLYLWSFFAFAAVLLVQVMVLLYQNRDRMAALALRQPIPAPPSEEPSNAEDSKTALVGR